MTKDPLYFEAIGERFDQWMSDYDVERRWELIVRLLPAACGSLSCLEVGCGTGRISRLLKPRVKHLVVSDISGTLAERVGQRVGVAWSAEDACRLSFPDASFDLVVSSECIEHTPDPAAALREIARVVRPGGRVVITSPNRLWLPVLLLAQGLRLRRFDGTEHWLWPSQARHILLRAGLGEAVLSGCHAFPWQLPFAKRILPALDRRARFLYPLMINYGVTAAKPSTLSDAHA